MNFLAHAVLAADERPDPLFVFGSMVPDFAHMAGLRHRGSRLTAVGDGVDYHHACDAIFHELPRFLDALARERRALRELGLPTGPARAVSHIGVELMIDGGLARRESAVELYRRAISDPRVEAGDAVDWSVDPRRSEDLGVGERWSRAYARLRHGRLPVAYGDPEFVAARIAGVLAPRPRLAVPEERSAAVGEWAKAALPRYAAVAEKFVEETRLGLSG